MCSFSNEDIIRKRSEMKAINAIMSKYGKKEENLTALLCYS